MTRRVRLFIILGLALGLLMGILVRRVTREEEFAPVSPLQISSAAPTTLAASPLTPPTFTPLQSPLPVPPTAVPPVTAATLDAIRATRPTATPVSSSGPQLPYISPDTWRAWALRTLAAAGILAYIGLRLRRDQKT